METRRQLAIFGVLLAINALLALDIYLLFPLDQLVGVQAAPPSP